MRSLIFLGTLIALLKCVAAVLSNHHDHETLHRRQQDVLQLAEEWEANANITPLMDEEDVEAAQGLEIHTSDTPPPLDVLETADAKSPGHSDGATTKSSPYLSHKHRLSAGTSATQWAIAYTPYNGDLTCKSASAISSDVAIIAKKGFTSVRLYATDCRALQHVGAAAIAHGLKMIIGIHIDDPILGLAQPQITEIASWATSTGGWDTVEMVVVGNEAVFNEFVDAASLAAFITAARITLRDAGYEGPITTTEPLAIINDHAVTLCPVLDIAAANIHPFFHAEVSADVAGDYVVEQLDRLAEICDGLATVNLETGWPKRGRNNGIAVPSILDQMVAVNSIREQAGGKSVFLGFEDEHWKDGGEFDVERSWGCGYMFGEDN